MKWSEFSGAQDNAPKAKEGSWEVFSERLRAVPEGLPQGKKGMPAFSGAVFLPGTLRGQANVESLHLMCLDYDNATERVLPGEFYDSRCRRPKTEKIPIENPTQPEQIIALLNAHELSYQIYTTWSRTGEWMKFRVVIPFAAPVSPGVWASVCAWAVEHLNVPQHGLDIPVLLDSARMNFFAGSPNGKPEFWSGTGTPLKVPDEAFSAKTERIRAAAVLVAPGKAKTQQRSTNPARWGIDLRSVQLFELMHYLGATLGPERPHNNGTKRRCTCPWGAEHSNGPDSDDAVVFEGPGEVPSFACAHSQHQDMGLDDVLELAKDNGLDLLEYAQSYFETVEDKIAALASSNTVWADIQALIPLVIDMDPATQEKCVLAMAKAAGVTKKVINDALARAVPTAEDFCKWICGEMLKRWYAGGEHLVQHIDKTWWHYVGTHWRPLSNDNVLKQRLMEELEQNQDRHPKGRDLRSLMDTAFALLQPMQASHDDALGLSESKPRVLNCLNGEVWISDKGIADLRPHRASSHLTYVLDVNYEPEATCPTFDIALTDLFKGAKDPEGLIRHSMEFFGYALQPRREYKSWWILQGGGNNGKTKFMETLQRLMARDAVFSGQIEKIEKDNFTMAALAGKLLFMDDDVRAGAVIPDGLLKSLSEDKLVTARHLHKSHFTFIATVLPVMLCNNWPALKDLSQGTQNRAHILPFNRTFRPGEPGEPANPYPKIWKDEMSGVLNLAIAGYQRLQARGGFELPKDCLKAKQTFLHAANPLAAWVEDGCEQAPNLETPTTQLYSSYKSWATAEGHTVQLRKGDMERDLSSMGYDVRTNRHLKAKFVVGLRPLDPKEQF